ncbi:MAG: hypothetical protein FJ109_20245 [Deltaproteobacteria bacterium]|nr:hypothetical protein [Deltaproteobacteria bacterium]
MQLDWNQIRKLFGRDTVEPGDVVAINGQTFGVQHVGAGGAEFEELEDDPEDDEGDAGTGDDE